MKKLIINADDFGRHQLINRAVEEAVVKGCLRSATLMPGGEAFDNAVEVARRNPTLGVGIHFTLVDDKPILMPESIPSLVTANGKFYDNYVSFLKRLLQGQIIFDEIRAELGAQLEKIKRTGLKLTHFDSHQHLHHIPGIIDIVLELAKSAGIRAMRAANTNIFDGEIKSAGQIIGRLGLFSFAKFASWRARKRGLATPDHFSGLVAGESVSEKFIYELIGNLEEGTTEVMLHPGTNNGVLQNYCNWQHDFEEELKAVTSPLNLQRLKEKNIYVENFSTLI